MTRERQKVTPKDKRHIYEFGEEHPLQAQDKASQLQDRLLVQIHKRQKLKDQEESSTVEQSHRPLHSSSRSESAMLFKKLLFSKPIETTKITSSSSEPKQETTDPILHTNKDVPFSKESFDLSQSDDHYKKKMKNTTTTPNNFSFTLEDYRFIGKSTVPIDREFFSEVNQVINPFGKLVGSFSDVLYCHSNYYSNVNAFRKMYCEHIVNYINQLHSLQRENESSDNSAGADSGFTKPKALILAPFKNFAYEIIRSLMKRSKTTRQVNAKRFEQEFAPQSTSTTSSDMFDLIFSGNLDDSFKIGICLHHGQSDNLKLFCDFYQSDIIVASPIALRQSIESNDCCDFLSSVQIVIVDGIDVVMMQNWEHLEFCFASLNKIPKQPRDCDFLRLREIYSDGNSAMTRQTILLSSLQVPCITSLFNRQNNQLAGRCLIRKNIINRVESTLSIPQSFTYIPVGSFSALDDDRFTFFTKTIYPQLTSDSSFQEGNQNNILIFISSYLDYTRLKMFFDQNDVDYESLTEYTTGPNISRVRGWFYNGQCRFLLITERFLFYKRYQIRGIRHLLWYSLPEYPQFYQLLSNMIGEYPSNQSAHCKCQILFSKWDSLKLERILGTDGATRATGDFVLSHK